MPSDLDLIPAGLARCDAAGRIADLNTTLLDWLGEARADDYLGRPVHALFTPAGKIYFETHIRPMLMIEGEVREISLELSGRAGKRVRVYLNGRVERGADGEANALHFACFDGHQRHLYEQELLTKRRSAERYAALVEASPDAILNLDADLSILGWNAAATQIFGYDEAALRDRSVDQLLGPQADGADLMQGLGRLQSEAALRVETTFRDARGDALPVEINASAVRDEFGTFAGVVMVIRDIRERRRNEAMIRTLNNEIIHRSTNQFSVVRAIARSTLRHSAPEDFAQTFEDRIEALARNFTLLGEQSGGTTTLEALVQSQLDHLGPGQRARISVSGPDVRIKGRIAETLGLAIFELSTNAIKYGALSEAAGQSGRLDISWTQDESQLALRWKETGVGTLTPPSRKGFGSQLTGPMLEQFTHGTVEADYRPDGLSWTLTMPSETILGE